MESQEADRYGPPYPRLRETLKTCAAAPYPIAQGRDR